MRHAEQKAKIPKFLQGFLITIIDPLGQPKVTAGSDN